MATSSRMNYFGACLTEKYTMHVKAATSQSNGKQNTVPIIQFDRRRGRICHWLMAVINFVMQRRDNHLK